MRYRQFEDLPVWQESAELARLMLAFVALDAFRGHGGIRDQLERAAFSMSNNIAEGFERGSTNELLAFLYIARGSAGEVRSMLRVLEKWQPLANHKSQISDLRQRCERISKQLYRWIEQLKNTEIRASAISMTRKELLTPAEKTAKNFSKNYGAPPPGPRRTNSEI